VYIAVAEMMPIKTWPKDKRLKEARAFAIIRIQNHL
jgi:hypothetical protein